ncbi:MAG: M28 family peptidase [Bacteroidales bacterium]|nr:M28 family peptidase [Bacteroidales bacterium]
MQTKNIKNYFKTLTAALTVMLMSFNADAQNSWLSMHIPARNLIIPDRLEAEVGFLSDSLCQGRGTGTAGSVEASSWIVRKFEQIGLHKMGDTWTQSFVTENGVIGRNVTGMLQGSSKEMNDRYIIIGAHYDHLGILDGKIYYGADSNASGTVAMTSLAEMLATTRSIGRNYRHNIIFVGFDGKEMSMAGSQAMWDLIKSGQLKDPLSGKPITKDKIAFMVNIDQIGSTLEPINKDRKDFIIMLGGSSFRHSYDNLLVNVNEMYDINLDLGFTYYGSENFTKMFYRLSDQRIFVDNKIPAILFTSGITMNTNKTKDRIETLDMDVLQKRIYLMYHWVEKML